MISTDEPVSPSPTSSTALPHLDLAPPSPEERSPVGVVLRPSRLEQGLHTRTCPQCGLNPAGAPVKRTFQWVPPWVYFGLLLNIVILMILYYAGRRIVKGELPLCSDCDVADRRGRRLRSFSVAGIFLGPLVFAGLGGVTLGSEAAAAGALIGLVSGIVGIVASHRRTRFDVIGVKHIDRKRDTMTLTASPTFGRVLAAEAPDALLG